MSKKTEDIYTTNLILSELKTEQEKFKKDAAVLNQAKCQLANDDLISDFCIDGIWVSVEKDGNNYCLYYDDCGIFIETNKRMITYYSYLF